MRTLPKLRSRLRQRDSSSRDSGAAVTQLVGGMSHRSQSRQKWRTPSRWIPCEMSTVDLMLHCLSVAKSGSTVSVEHTSRSRAHQSKQCRRWGRRSCSRESCHTVRTGRMSSMPSPRCRNQPTLRLCVPCLLPSAPWPWACRRDPWRVLLWLACSRFVVFPASGYRETDGNCSDCLLMLREKRSYSSGSTYLFAWVGRAGRRWAAGQLFVLVSREFLPRRAA